MPTEQLKIDAVELLPCPFCGPGQSMVDPWFDDVSKRWVVGCGRCGSSSGRSVHAEGSKEAAIKSWNTRIPAQGSLEPGWQQNIMDWAVERFGPVALNPRERAMRFVEEALELGQTQQLNIEDAHALVRRVYSRDPGDAPKEIGQAGMTLEALAFNIGQSVPDQIAIEIERIQTIPIAEWQRRHAAKIAVGAALPSTQREITPADVLNAMRPRPSTESGSGE